MTTNDLQRVQAGQPTLRRAPAPEPGQTDLNEMGQNLLQRVLSISIYTLASLIGVTAFIYPFFALTQQAATTQQMAHGADSPLILALLIGLCLAALAVEAQGQAMSAKLIALLGILVAINSALRFAEAVVRGPGGFSPVFMLIIVCGYVFGPRFGFLMGILSLLVSAIITGGVGPWMPYQMFTAGWMGMSAGWIGQLRDWLVRITPRPADALEQAGVQRATKLEVAVLCFFGALWGFAYGAIMNLWFWPFQVGDPAQSWQAGLTFWQGIQRYLAFYLATSFIWDVFAAAGNIALLALFGLPTIRALRRFKDRFLFTIDTRHLAAERI